MQNTKQDRIFDSLKAASAGMKIPLSRLQKLKARGAAGFVNGRVDAAALTAWINAHPTTAATTPPVKAATLPTGAGSALLRLEEHEALAYQQMHAAMASGDTDEIERCRKAWLEVSEQLRKGDLAVEVARRDAGALVPRADVERGLFMFGCYLHAVHIEGTMLALKELSKLAPKIDPQGVSDILATMEWQSLLTSAAGMCSDKVTPPWLSAAVLSFWNSNMHRGISDRAEKIAEMLRHLVSEPKDKP